MSTPTIGPDDAPLVARRRPRWGRIALGVGVGTLVLLAAVGVAIAVFVRNVARTAPGVDELRELQAARPSVLMSADGKTLVTFKRAQQEKVTLAQISPHVTKSLLATEDQHFYEHGGVDLRRTAAAAWSTLTGSTQGGSTITQQLARNLFPDDIGRSRTLTRKVKELVTALRIERLYSKPQILELYLNTAPFLYNVVGIEMAARTYYDKPAAELDLLESATLIGMLKGMSYYNPIVHPERAKERRNVVLAQLVKRGELTDARYRDLRNAPLSVELHRQPEIVGDAPHFTVAMRKWLIDWADAHDYNLYSDGLVVQTTIDSRLQEAATRAVQREAAVLQAVADVEWSSPRMRVASTAAESYVRQQGKVEPFAAFWSQRQNVLAAIARESPEFKQALKSEGSEAAALRKVLGDGAWLARTKKDKSRLEAGFVALDPSTGEVKAWVGSRDFSVDQFDHVAQAERQPGSTFKPFVYGAALENGFLPDRTYVDAPVEIALPDGTMWRPTDMSGTSGQTMSLRDGLVYSKNTITAQVAQDVGMPRIVALAKSMGVDQSRLDPVPSLALGTSPVTLLEMVTAYSTIAQQGQYHQPVMIKRITDRRGEVLADFTSETRRAMSPDAAADLTDMMRGVIQRGTGTQIRSRFGITGDVAGKTGTTQNNTDGWFILMHPGLVAGAWVGFNDQRVALRSDYWGQGGHNAVLLVGDFFKTVQKSGMLNPKARFPPPRHPYVAPASPPPDESIEAALRNEPPGAIAPPPRDIEVVSPQDSGGVIIGGKASVTTSRPLPRDPPKSAEELARAMQSMGRDPVTGEPLGSRSGNAPSRPNREAASILIDRDTPTQ